MAISSTRTLDHQKEITQNCHKSASFNPSLATVYISVSAAFGGDAMAVPAPNWQLHRSPRPCRSDPNDTALSREHGPRSTGCTWLGGTTGNLHDEASQNDGPQDVISRKTQTTRTELDIPDDIEVSTFE